MGGRSFTLLGSIHRRGHRPPHSASPHTLAHGLNFLSLVSLLILKRVTEESQEWSKPPYWVGGILQWQPGESRYQRPQGAERPGGILLCDELRFQSSQTPLVSPSVKEPWEGTHWYWNICSYLLLTLCVLSSPTPQMSAWPSGVAQIASY